MFESEVDLIHVQRQLAEHFALEELRTLCFDLSLDYEEFAGDTKTAKTRELVKHCHRYGLISQLLEHCEKQRPNVKWNQPAEPYKATELPEEWVEPLQRLYRLVRAFNRNRHMPFSNERTRLGDDIAFEMREAAPFLFNQFDVERWLNSGNTGKRLAAIKYLDWLQDIEFLENLFGKLVTESPFMQLHILVTIDSMLDQLDVKHQAALKAALTAYKITRKDADREFWRKRILSRLENVDQS